MKIAAATAISAAQNDAFAKQLKRQQQQFDTLMGKVQAMVTTLQSHNAQATTSFRQGNPSFGIRGRGRMPFHNNGERGVPRGRGLPPQGRWRGQPQPQRLTPNLILLNPSWSRGMSGPMLTTNIGNVGRWDILRGTVPC